LPDRSELFDDVLALSIARDDSRRDLLLRVLVDSFVREAGPRRPTEVRQFEELAGHLIGQVGPGTLALVAAKLAGRADVPASIRARLGEPPPRPAAAAPSAMPPASPPPRAEVRPTAFLDQPPAERRATLLRLSAVAIDAPLAPPAPDLVRRLMRHAVLRRRDAFGAEMGGALGLEPRVAAQVADDPDGEPLVVAARALGLAEDALAQLLLLLNPAIGESYDKVVRLRELYRRVSPEAAAAVVAEWRSAPEPAPRHAPHLAPERRIAAPARKAVREAAPDQATSASPRK
jgi:hypothetical protein